MPSLDQMIDDHGPRLVTLALESARMATELWAQDIGPEFPKLRTAMWQISNNLAAQANHVHNIAIAAGEGAHP